jgi:hypothetical protein
MEGVRGEHLTPGEFRRSQNRIGGAKDQHLGSTIEGATIVPPTVNEMHPALDALEKFIYAPSDMLARNSRNWYAPA